MVLLMWIGGWPVLTLACYRACRLVITDVEVQATFLMWFVSPTEAPPWLGHLSVIGLARKYWSPWNRDTSNTLVVLGLPFGTAF